MTYGLNIEAGLGGLTISSDGITYGYIGRATNTGVSQSGGTTNNRSIGQSSYTINWAGDIVVALPIKANKTTALVNITQSGEVWTITCHAGTGTFDSFGFENQEATEVYVFGAPVSVSGFGLALYNASGGLCADLSRQPMTVRGVSSHAANVYDWLLPSGMTTPAVVGTPEDYETTSARDGAFWINRFYSYGWTLFGGNLRRVPNAIRRLREDGPIGFDKVINAMNAIVIEASGLT
jgi:hypothetical protein